jgi:hypothetical protein
MIYIHRLWVGLPWPKRESARSVPRTILKPASILTMEDQSYVPLGSLHNRISHDSIIDSWCTTLHCHRIRLDKRQDTQRILICGQAGISATELQVHPAFCGVIDLTWFLPGSRVPKRTSQFPNLGKAELYDTNLMGLGRLGSGSKHCSSAPMKPADTCLPKMRPRVRY